MSATYSSTPRTRVTRHRERLSYDVEAVHAVLDEALVCHLGVVIDGAPVVLPTMHVRVGEELYVHGSSGAGVLRAVPPAGLPVCVTVTLLDGLVLAKSQFSHSMNYRSVVVHGVATRVEDEEEKRRALTALVEHAVPGRAADSRPPDARELAATALLRLPLREVSLKTRTGPPNDDEADLALPHWTGVLPVHLAVGPPEPGGAAPRYVEGRARQRPPGSGQG